MPTLSSSVPKSSRKSRSTKSRPARNIPAGWHSVSRGSNGIAPTNRRPTPTRLRRFRRCTRKRRSSRLALGFRLRTKKTTPGPKPKAWSLKPEAWSFVSDRVHGFEACCLDRRIEAEHESGQTGHGEREGDGERRHTSAPAGVRRDAPRNGRPEDNAE